MARKPRFDLDPEKFPLGSTKRRKALDLLRKRADRLRDCPRGKRLRRKDPLIGLCAQCGCTFRCWSARAINCSKECTDQRKKRRKGRPKPAWNRQTDPQRAPLLVDQLYVDTRRNRHRDRYRLPDDYPTPPWVEQGNGCWTDPWWSARTVWRLWAKATDRDDHPEPPLPVAGEPRTWTPWAPVIQVAGKSFKVRTPADVRKLRRAQDEAVQVVVPQAGTVTAPRPAAAGPGARG